MRFFSALLLAVSTTASLATADALVDSLREPQFGAAVLVARDPAGGSETLSLALQGEIQERNLGAVGQLSARDIFGRQSCATTEKYCSDNGGCCPALTTCCSKSCTPSLGACCTSGYSCASGKKCCGTSSCVPFGGECCGDGSYCTIDIGTCFNDSGTWKCRKYTSGGSSGGVSPALGKPAAGALGGVVLAGLGVGGLF